MKRKSFFSMIFAAVALLTLGLGVTNAQAPVGTAFTYQGRLTDGGSGANGAYDFGFKLLDAANGGSQIGTTLFREDVDVANGLFVVNLDFGAVFGTPVRYLEVSVRAGNSGGAYTTLSPRQRLTPTPNALFSSAPWQSFANDIYYSQGNVGIGTSIPGRSLHISAPSAGVRMVSSSASAWTTTEYHAGPLIWHTGVGGSAVSNDVKGKYYIYDGTAAQFRMVFDTDGDVGIGTTAPSALLSVVKSGAPQPSVQGFATGLKVGTPSGTMPLALKQNAAENANPGIAYFETATGDLGSLGANDGAFVVGAAANKALALNVNGATRALTIASNGAIGVGTTNIGAKMEIKSAGTTNATQGFRVTNGNSSTTFAVRDDGRVYIGHFGSDTTTSHVCQFQNYLVPCGSAAEYVPTVDAGNGFPETADLVSIAPNFSNPYGDTHGPFVVHKSTTACDSNLIGFVVNPKSGADGIKLNEHYLPLAIFGYFPVNVTLENGAIKRGDPLTSSSKPGYAMKATGACRIIGYALQDAAKEGQIQVFADLGEHSAPTVTALQARVDELEQKNAALEERLLNIERLLLMQGNLNNDHSTALDVTR